MNVKQKNRAELLIKSSDFRSWNNEMASRYSPELYHKKSFFIVRFIEKLRVKAIIRLLATKDKEKVLEIGCGSGNIIEYFKKGELFGIDLSEQLLKMAGQKEYKVRVRLAQSFGEDLPFRTGAFDKIYCSEVLEHVRDPIAILKEARQVLTNDGLLVISVPNESFINLLKKVMHFFRMDNILNSVSEYKFSICMTDEWHLHHFNLKFTKEILKDLFKIERLHFVPSTLFPIRIVLACKKSH